MTSMTQDHTATKHELRHPTIPAGQARSAMFRRVYDAGIEDVWDACTNPERLARWYQPVQGDLRLGGEFTQGEMGGGRIVACEAPRLLRLALGPGDPSPDQLELRLSSAPDGTTVLELEHATMLDTHEIGGQIYDAVYCMGGGYGPRLLALDLYLHDALPADLDVTQMHMREEFRPAIETSMAEIQQLLDADKA
ncbi:MAG: hypothetical protein QOE05_3774 [Actinomycetota bacterium]|jgi:uncharacterized protein YndB with AHSA1/START domain|nr:hypothetical protein [Actinomycetota bacterium]